MENDFGIKSKVHRLKRGRRNMDGGPEKEELETRVVRTHPRAEMRWGGEKKSSCQVDLGKRRRKRGNACSPKRTDPSAPRNYHN